jgi:hypothetical protein
MATTPSGYRAIANSEKTPVPGAHKIGPADPKEVMSVSIRVRSRTDQPQSDVNTIAAAPHGERKHISREEFAQTYGASQPDLDAVTAFAKNHGLKVEEVSAARRTVRGSRLI